MLAVRLALAPSGLVQRGKVLEARLISLEDWDAVKDEPLTTEDIQNASLHTFAFSLKKKKMSHRPVI